MSLLDIILDPKDGYPLWLMVICIIIGVLGLLWSRIKSTYELKMVNRQKITEKKLDEELSEINTLRKRVANLEIQNLRLIKSNTAFASTMMMMIDKYSKSNPDDTTVIEIMTSLIKSTLEGDYEFENKT